jgi:hypothetical protein
MLPNMRRRASTPSRPQGAGGVTEEKTNDADVVSPELKTVLKCLRLSRVLDTLPERLTLAR